MTQNSDISPTERIAAVSALLATGHRFTTEEVCKRYEITHSGAWRLMARLCRVDELSLVFVRGEWFSAKCHKIDID